VWTLSGGVTGWRQDVPRWGSGMMTGSGVMGGMHGWMMGGGGGDQAPQGDIPPGAPVSEQRVSIREWAMDPPTITVKSGSHVKLVVRNEGTMAHNFAVPSLGVRITNIAPGTSRQIDLYARQSGTYAYLCDIPGHAQAGQKGDLIVQ